MADLTFYRGDTVRRRLTFKRKDGSVVDISGSKIMFTVKEDAGDADTAAKIGPVSIAEHIDAAAGVSEMVLPPTQTDLEAGLYAFDFQLVAANGDVSTLVVGSLEVKQDVTKGV